MNVLTVCNLKKSCVERGITIAAVRNVSLQIDAGEVVAFFEPNGRAKKIALERVVLQKVVEERELLGEGIDYAATPKISALEFDSFSYGSFFNASSLAVWVPRKARPAQLFPLVPFSTCS